MQRSTPDNEDHRRPESRSVQEMAADSLVGKATSEILMLVPPFTPCNVHLQCNVYLKRLHFYEKPSIVPGLPRDGWKDIFASVRSDATPHILFVI